ncbi:MAG TPA: tol-pal system-associated acyl-CoA thioesterase [Gammaproteobacteria bacterium]|nr:tol-pal system-associated acyl-CoA thioesterase [Gammaproteobacteria bacterium]
MNEGSYTEGVFSWPVRVYYEDTDFAGVVYYANYLKFMERSRTEYLRFLGVEQDTLRTESNCIFVVRQALVDFHQAARFNDALNVQTSVKLKKKASILFHQRIEKAEKKGGSLLICSADVTIACVDAGTFRPMRIPRFLLEMFERDS